MNIERLESVIERAKEIRVVKAKDKAIVIIKTWKNVYGKEDKLVLNYNVYGEFVRRMADREKKEMIFETMTPRKAPVRQGAERVTINA